MGRNHNHRLAQSSPANDNRRATWLVHIDNIIALSSCRSRANMGIKVKRKKQPLPPWSEPERHVLGTKISYLMSRGRDLIMDEPHETTHTAGAAPGDIVRDQDAQTGLGVSI